MKKLSILAMTAVLLATGCTVPDAAPGTEVPSVTPQATPEPAQEAAPDLTDAERESQEAQKAEKEAAAQEAREAREAEDEAFLKRQAQLLSWNNLTARQQGKTCITWRWDDYSLIDAVVESSPSFTRREVREFYDEKCSAWWTENPQGLQD